jgi:hypothetical protein
VPGLEIQAAAVLFIRITQPSHVHTCCARGIKLDDRVASVRGAKGRLVASVLLEGREHVKPDLGPEIEMVLAQDARKCAEAVNTCRAKLSGS